MSRFVAGGRKAGNEAVKRRDKVAMLAIENAALKGHIRTLVLAGEAALARLECSYAVAIDETTDLKAAIDAAKLGK